MQRRLQQRQAHDFIGAQLVTDELDLHGFMQLQERFVHVQSHVELFLQRVDQQRLGESINVLQLRHRFVEYRLLGKAGGEFFIQGQLLCR